MQTNVRSFAFPNFAFSLSFFCYGYAFICTLLPVAAFPLGYCNLVRKTFTIFTGFGEGGTNTWTKSLRILFPVCWKQWRFKKDKCLWNPNSICLHLPSGL